MSHLFFETYGISEEEAKRIFKEDTKEVEFNVNDVVSFKDSYELGLGVIIDKWIGGRYDENKYTIFISGLEHPYFCLEKFYVTGEGNLIQNPRLTGELYIDPNFTFGVDGKEKLIFKLRSTQEVLN